MKKMSKKNKRYQTLGEEIGNAVTHGVGALLGILGLVLAGGVMYSGDIAFYIADFKYSHFVWHFFVIFGTICHFIGVYLYIL